MSKRQAPACPLCASHGAVKFYEKTPLTYYRCGDCRLVYLDPAHRLEKVVEKSRYDLHQNSASDSGYRNFLDRLRGAMAPCLNRGDRGLDFGSGPEPVLAQMFEELGYEIVLYDPFFAPGEQPLAEMYEFIVASEVAEHLFAPKFELDRLWSCLKPGGTMGIMTAFLTEGRDFANWHYRRDDTHVCFYSRDTFDWLANRWGAKASFVGDSVVLFEKKALD